MTVVEFGRKMKAKEPRLARLSDKEAGQQILDEEPQYRQYVSDYKPKRQKESKKETAEIVVVEKQPEVQTSGGPRSISPFGDFSTDVQLPPRPNLPQPHKSVVDTQHQLVDSYHPGKGWWAGLFAENRTRVAELLADQSQHLLRLQQCVDASEAAEYLKAHHLWSEEIAALLRGEQAQTGIVRERKERASLANQAYLESNAAKVGFTLQNHQAELLAENAVTRTIRQKREEKNIDWEDHARRERLKVELEIREYHEKVSAYEKLALTDEKLREVKLSMLENMFRKLRSLETEEEDIVLREQLREMWKAEIKRLQGELHGLEKTADERREKIFGGKKDGGGGAAPQSEQPSGPNMGEDKQPPSGNKTRNVN